MDKTKYIIVKITDDELASLAEDELIQRLFSPDTWYDYELKMTSATMAVVLRKRIK